MSRVRAQPLAVLLLVLCAPCLRGESAPQFADPAALESFVLAASDDGVKQALETALTLAGAGDMIGLAAKMGPAYASRVAGVLPDPGFRESYGDLAKYLDLFGPCQKQQSGTREGWWSNYPDQPSESYCSEAAKLLFGALLWNQVHYCSRLASGEEKPKTPVPSGKQPPYRLDEPPVQTHWLHAAALYAVADAALHFEFGKTLRARAADADERVRMAMLAAAGELERETPSRERIAFAIAKLLLRRYERLHLDHLARINATSATTAKPD